MQNYEKNMKGKDAEVELNEQKLQQRPTVQEVNSKKKGYWLEEKRN